MYGLKTMAIRIDSHEDHRKVISYSPRQMRNVVKQIAVDKIQAAAICFFFKELHSIHSQTLTYRHHAALQSPFIHTRV